MSTDFWGYPVFCLLFNTDNSVQPGVPGLIRTRYCHTVESTSKVPNAQRIVETPDSIDHETFQLEDGFMAWGLL